MISKIVSGGAPGAEKGALISANIYGITTTGTGYIPSSFSRGRAPVEIFRGLWRNSHEYRS